MTDVLPTILFSLTRYQRAGGGRRACPDNAGDRMDIPGRGSFSPDVWFDELFD